ncbi:hypothetical protein A3B05_02450 [Candidatus Giovannonibacteria bacterium RIFCSPLOWO2_01_FULL_43_160]|uniref:Two-component sensor kinase n=2 Tax=Candidatus Giovannoniibacteriota TaxID=1752738 RepID=A0A0G1L2X8_9BACT|nr:MAG: Two-component sensor kinase [Candidatus Giovannonibacteria bacterium GW2011_GWB1_43_13]KKS99191.1 MAG: Two-component sensor kinase [Candidatus Giovannonibacteria bacterium GW2011_GWA1_43_15]KKT21294.1 MAG: Two-component sensor kinase [Candidatus Giovannonibacteria bacterium GW2011_GWC2_43_8]KKT62992.1 MAG: Two-component sensor kinase [Candidatus Giovannonibacteria bacterium GW2011_GWA2_44_26]OGF58454.1 MAG: hypothetical protein A2652_01630 [Candidatus Giovannonibacteria bacterium RIFCSP
MKIDFLSDINKDNYYVLDYDRVDAYMVKTAWCSSVFLALYSWAIYFWAPAASYPNPFSWRVVTFGEVIWVTALGFLTAIVITVFRGRLKNHYVYRFIVTNALMAYSYLVVFISGGSIEWHFHFFVMLALITLYADWRLGWWAIIAVALHHNILNFISPGWVYFYGRNDVASLAHAFLVFFMAIITTKICEQNRQLADASRLIGNEFDKNTK